ncbi:MAG TPA: methyltransferase domain-containing protein, partial [Saprospiraceae bacterium]|nr:methyltransferase domain-containing protein [Saprospiraceae bacterium]
MIQKAIKFILSNRALRKKAVELLKKLNASAFETSKLIKFDSFKDEFGNVVDLKEGLRSMIKPGWQSTFENKPIKKIRQKDIIDKNKDVSDFVNTMILTLSKITNHKFNNVLEIGSYDTFKATSVANKWPDSKVVSGDVDYYYDDDQIDQIRENRKIIQSYFGVNNLSFDIHDITNSQYSDNQFELTFSADVLEHVPNIERCFQELYRITRTGGFGYHVYNPFFSYNGGHTYATLDFPWGHASLSDNDFEKYLKKYRPNEFDKARDFYIKSLNRCTLIEMETHIKNAGFHIHSILKETK